MAQRTWQVPNLLLAYLQRRGGQLQTQAVLEIEWHEIRGLRIELTDEYDVHIDFPRIRGAEMSIGEVRKVGTDRFSGFLALREDGTYRGLVRATTSSEYYERALAEECSTSLRAEQDMIATAEPVRQGHPGDIGLPIRLRFYPIAPPELDELGCDYELEFYWGSEPHEDPLIDPEEAIPSQFFAPFNDQRILKPDEAGFLTAMPPSGKRTYIYREYAEGMGGGTSTVSVEVVEPQP